MDSSNLLGKKSPPEIKGLMEWEAKHVLSAWLTSCCYTYRLFGRPFYCNHLADHIRLVCQSHLVDHTHLSFHTHHVSRNCPADQSRPDDHNHLCPHSDPHLFCHHTCPRLCRLYWNLIQMLFSLLNVKNKYYI